jgi:hypothetical protein
MLAAVIEGPGAVVVRDTAPPRAAGPPLARVTPAGISGTDRTAAADGIAVRPPRVPGEAARAEAASERPEHLDIVLDVAGP